MLIIFLFSFSFSASVLRACDGDIGWCVRFTFGIGVVPGIKINSILIENEDVIIQQNHINRLRTFQFHLEREGKVAAQCDAT